MEYTPLWPNWFYSYIDIPNLEPLREELRAFVNNPDKKSFATNSSYINVMAEYVFPQCPLLKKYLVSVGLEKKFHRLLISRKIVLSEVGNVHVDTYSPEFTRHSINIGIQDYEDSFTRWFKTDQRKLNDVANRGWDPISNFAWIPLEEATEIKRLQWSNRPTLVNTTILHQGYSEKESRVIVGLRFKPELTESDIKRLGVNRPHVQED